jgi:putative sterol carrier protein
MSTQQQHQLADYFPTTAWLDNYQQALESSAELDETGAGWGVGWNGDFVFEIQDLPLEAYTVADLPDELWSALETAIEQLPADTVEDVVATAPDVVQEGIEAREGDINERAIAELRETRLADTPERIWPEFENLMPDILVDLIQELEDNVADGGTVYAWIGLKDGGCYEVETMQSLDEREFGMRLEAGYEQWVALTSGEMDVVQGIMSGDLELDGDMQKILQYSDAALTMTDVAAEMDKRYLF